MGTYTQTNGVLSITFTTDATHSNQSYAEQSRINALLSSITYKNTNLQASGSIPIQWTFDDGSGQSNSSGTSITNVSITPSYTINNFLSAASGLANNSVIVTDTGTNFASALSITNFTSNTSKIISVAVTGSVDANTLLTLDGIFTNAIDATAVTSITGTASSIVSVVNATGITKATNFTATLSDTSVNVSDLNTIDAATTGVINANSVTTLGGTTSEIQTTLNAIVLGHITDTGLNSIGFNNDATNTLTMVDANVSANSVLTVGAFSMTNPLTFDGSAETDGKFSIIGGSGADNITGGSGSDTIVGGSGNNTIYGGNGADSIIGGTGADSISGGDGSDTIYGGGGADNISAGAGNNVIVITDHTALSSIASIDGGTGNDDTLSIVGDSATPPTAGNIVDTDFTHVSNIERLSVESTVTGTLTLGTHASATGIKYVDVSTSGITKINAYDDAHGLIISAGTATTTITGGSGNDIINMDAQNSPTTITGGEGSDTINLSVSHSSKNTIVLGTISKDTINNFRSGIDTIKLGGTTQAVAKTVADLTSAAVAQVDTVTISSATSGNTITIGGVATADVTVTLDATSGASVDAAAAVLVTAINAATGVHVTAAVTSGGALTLTAKVAGVGFTETQSATGATLAAVQHTTANAVYAGVANEIIFDTSTNLGASAINIGDQRAATYVPHYAVASDTGAIYYDPDGNWTDADTKQIGAIGVVSGISINDFTN